MSLLRTVFPTIVAGCAALTSACVPLPRLSAPPALAPNTRQQRQKLALVEFGDGWARAIRQSGNPAKRTNQTDWVFFSKQSGPGYSIDWITKRDEPDSPFPARLLMEGPGMSVLGFHLGKARPGDVLSNFGEPNERQGEKWTYDIYSGGPGDDRVIFTFRKGRLSAAEWVWFVE